MIMMVKSYPGIWCLTNEYEFTGRWRCDSISDHCDTDIEFEIRCTRNFIHRLFTAVPKYHWAYDRMFYEVNECGKVNDEHYPDGI